MRKLIPGLMVLSSLLFGCASTGSYQEVRTPGRCSDCAVVENIVRVSGSPTSSGGGAVAGAIIGGILGNQVGGGSGKKVATVAGAVAGGVVGNELEKDANAQPRFEITVRMEDGRRRVYTQKDSYGLRPGDNVVTESTRVVPLR